MNIILSNSFSSTFVLNLRVIFQKEKKLKLYSSKYSNDFAIKIGGEKGFRAATNPIAQYNKVIDDTKIKTEEISHRDWNQILRRWTSQINNINQKDYKILKSIKLLQFIDEDEKLIIRTEKTSTNAAESDFDKVFVTNKKIIIVKALTRFLRMDWEPFFIPLDEVKSIEISKGLLSIFSRDIIVNTTRPIKINSIKNAIAEEIVNYINGYIRDKTTKDTSSIRRGQTSR
jgi:hypothetical protein